MKISAHVAICKEKIGVEAADIHEWIDGLFDHGKFATFIQFGFPSDFNPYDHRRHRHCQEALNECLERFKDKYPEETIREVFESHVREDYEGFYPMRSDFENPVFHEKYHSK